MFPLCAARAFLTLLTVLTSAARGGNLRPDSLKEGNMFPHLLGITRGAAVVLLLVYSIARLDARTIMVYLPGFDASRLFDTYAVKSPLVSSVIVEPELHGPDNFS